MTALAPILEAFFTDRLMTQRGASPHTIASYRDTFTLLLGYIHQQTGKLPAQLDLADLDAATIGAFLQQLEASRGNSAATRNARLAAIRSLFRYASLRAPEHAALIGRVLAIQPKRTTTTIVSFLTRGELNALLAAPDRGTWHGRRDHALLVFAAQTGLRVSELTGLAVHDVHLGTGPHAYCRGKGRKDRATPLTAHTVEVLAAWLAEQHAGPASPLFATRAGTPLWSTPGLVETRFSPDALVWVTVVFHGTAAWRNHGLIIFPLLFYRTSVQLRCPSARLMPGSAQPGSPPGAGYLLVGHPGFAPRVPRAGQG